tara:strand:+ start:1127 stop:2299 length:1173 start_codon:yes stop_codon:yes gene_type:complete
VRHEGRVDAETLGEPSSPFEMVVAIGFFDPTIELFQPFATGVFISEIGLVCTARHVFEFEPRFLASMGHLSPRSFPAVMQHYDDHTIGIRPIVAVHPDRRFYLRYERPQATRPIYTLDYLKSIGGALTTDEEILLLSSRRVQIRAIAVWDTVGALGVPFGNIPGLSRKEFQFHNTRLSNIFDYAFQALAIDEHRQAFEPTLWSRFVPEPLDPPPPAAPREPVVEQRWFIGAHADVGGGNPTALPEIAMAWLAEKAEQAGLALKEPSVSSPAAFRAPITDSFADFAFGLYKLLKGGNKFIRTIQAARILKETHEETGKPQRAGWVETVNETIDASVFDRFRADSCYRPPALMNWAGLHGVDPASVHGAVECPTAGPVVTRTQSGRPVTGGH